MIGEKRDTDLHLVLLDPRYFDMWAEQVFELANELSRAYGISGEGRTMGFILDRPDWSQSDAEILIRLVVETALGYVARSKPWLLKQLMEQIERAYKELGVEP